MPGILTELHFRERLASVARAKGNSVTTDAATLKRIAILCGVASFWLNGMLESGHCQAVALLNDEDLPISIGDEHRSHSIGAPSIPMGGQPDRKPTAGS